MIAYRRFLTVSEPRRVVLDDLPFTPGQRLEVLVLAASSSSDQNEADPSRLFRETQVLPQVMALTDDDIAAEIAAYRKGN